MAAMDTLRDRFLGLLARRRCGAKQRSPRRARYRPWVEVLESRTVPTTAVVNSIADSGAGSLRAALTTSGVDTINFNLPGRGVHVIQLLSPISITSTVLIDGYSQP